MNRFISRVLPLLLAVLFLLSAAGTSFAVLMRGFHVYADEPSSRLITAAAHSQDSSASEPETSSGQEPASEPASAQSSRPVVATTPLAESAPPTESNFSISKILVDAGGEDLSGLTLQDGETVTLKLTVKDLELTKEQYEGLNKSNCSIESTRFTIDPTKVTWASEATEVIQDGSTGCTYSITITDATYIKGDNSDSVPFKISYDNHATPPKTASYPIIPETPPVTTDPTYEKPSGGYFYYNGENKPFEDRIRAGRTFRFKVIINDPEIPYSVFMTAFGKDKDFIQVAMQNNNFRNDPYVEILSPNKMNAGSGTQFTLMLDNLRYEGNNDMLEFSFTYKGIPNPFTRQYSVQHSELEPEYVNSYYHKYDDDDDDDSSSRPDIPPPTPNIIVSEFDYGGGSVTAASNFDLNITFKNTSKKLPIDNIVVKVTVPEAFTMNGSSNTFYVEKLGKDSAVERKLSLSVKPNAEPISHAIKLSFAFEAVIEEARKQFTSEEEISIPVSQLDRFSLNPVEVPSTIFVGEGANVEATFVNKGKTPVYNVSAEIVGNVSQPGQKQFIGNIEAGKEETADFNINSDEPGEITGEILITYEDANMKIGTLRSPFTTTAQSYNMPPDMDDMMTGMEEIPAEEDNWQALVKKVPVWGWMVGGVVLLILIAFVIKAARAHHERKLEEQDEDF